jgi:hypothetical protein
VTGSGTVSVSSGLSFHNGSGGRITGSRIEGNSNFGVHVYPNAGVVTLDSLNSLAGNTYGGVANEQDSPLWAERNWWGAADGPHLESGGPLDIFGWVDYANYLTARPIFPSWIGAPPAHLAGAVRPAATAVRSAEGSVERQRPDRAARHARISRAAARRAPQPTAARPAPRPTAAVAHAHSRPPLMSYRKGAPPRPATVHHPQ